MEKIDEILEKHSLLAESINKLKSSTKLCISSISSDMLKTKSELDWLNSSENITSEEFILINSYLKDIGKEFDRCRCISRDEKL